MMDIKNVLEILNELVVLPIIIITFLLLIYAVFYLSKRDSDVVRSRIFLKYAEFKKAFILLAAFAFVLVLHVALIYIPHLYYIEYYSIISEKHKIEISNIDNLTEQ
ncbi:MAG: hypothetical protein KKD46_04170 [Euryarchaeota archaeon]|nr:hypothetical protein [Euryarchaeota archaeon]MBU4222492.1 hypothetical protein [Euryarchaeota archaeon]MBU4340098.1 hypothetical protein [Euryarchaeota archaeon]MBU4454105.1 hypothetical protein [Euryarchaeota archaeon]MCG2737322.1 hypothetical protein [Candidatus Methanoperedenaceae archaeon]